MTNNIVIINPRQEMRLEYDVMPRRDRQRIWKILEKIQLRSDHSVEKLRPDHVEKLRLDHAGRQLTFCHWGREWSSLP